MATEQDIRNQIEYGRYEGHKKGREEGRLEGLAEGEAKGAALKAIETARNFKANGIDAVLIARCTGLTVEEVEEL